MNGIATMPANLLTMPPAVTGDDDYQSLRLRLDFYQESIIRTRFDAAGQPVGIDELSPLDVASALADAPTAGGLLPPRTVYASVGAAAIYLPPQTRTLLVDGGQRYTLPLPPLVWVARHPDYYAIFALAGEEWPTLETALYHAPFPNVYPTGKVCPGGVEFPPMSLSGMHYTADLFFNSYFNNDLSHGKSRAYQAKIVDQWAKLASAAVEVYPAADLVPAGTKLGDVL